MSRWNRVYNLTAVRDPQAMLAAHLLDSLAAAPWLTGPRLLDIGSGAGLPGIPLAIARPELHFTLLDSSAKRTRFMQQMIAELGLNNVTLAHTRVEDFSVLEPGFACAVSRAFAALPVLVEPAARLLAPHGRLLAYKGVYPAAELEALPDGDGGGLRLVEVVRLTVPGLAAERHLVHLQKVR